MSKEMNALAWGATRQALAEWISKKLTEMADTMYPSNNPISQEAHHEKLIDLECDIIAGLHGLRRHIERGP